MKENNSGMARNIQNAQELLFASQSLSARLPQEIQPLWSSPSRILLQCPYTIQTAVKTDSTPETGKRTRTVECTQQL